VTQRLLNAIRNPHVDIIGHPTGRLIPNREGADLDMELVLNEALEHGVVMEINSIPARLDLDDVHARHFMEIGGLLSIDTDAHDPRELGMSFFGVATARRAWLQPENVINTWSTDRLMSWLGRRS
jgi:DNA polymerase (family X)